MNTLTRTEHACAIASNLGIRRILIHRFSSLLSAYGISLAEITSEASESLSLTLSAENMPQIEAREQAIKSKLEKELRSQDIIGDTIEYEVFLNLQYKGMDTSLSVEKPTDGSDYGSEFTSMHLREFAFTTNREIMVDSIRVRATAKNINQKESLSVSEELAAVKTSATVPEPKTSQRVFINDQWISTPIYELEDLTIGSHVTGPAIITDQTQTILIEPDYECHLTSRHLIIDKVETKQELSSSSQLSTETINPVQLSCFANRFMSIAEQMGNTLQRTSISTSIKERLDFSCAIFSPDGGLVANAPHIPIHLGSMQFAIQYQHRLWGDKLKPGDVLLTNHPEAGGTHLPDLTVVTPAFYDNQLIFYVASRGHHTDIGGIGITSMVPDSKELWQEGMAVKSMKIVSEGVFLENEVRDLFNKVAEYPGCSATRRLNDNISDIKAKISANQRGILLIKRLCEEFTLPVVHLYMGGIQRNAESAIKKLFRELYQKTGGKPLKAVDWFDDGTPVQVEITIDGEREIAVFDFAGTGPQTYGNMNMPISITHSAIIYVLRCMVDMDIPLNQGCLYPCEIRIPEGTILNPSSTVAICGSTISSQRVTDVILQAFGAAAGSQGCANSLGWGMGGKDPLTGIVTPGWNYGETVGGGSGAGPTWHGTHGVNVHSTNTKATDPEVIEKRTPVIVRRDVINHGTGGRGLYAGGDGMTREIEARISMKFSILSERRVYSPYSLEGGEPGSVGVNYIFKKNAEAQLEKINIGAKAVVWLNSGDYIQINSPGEYPSIFRPYSSSVANDCLLKVAVDGGSLLISGMRLTMTVFARCLCRKYTENHRCRWYKDGERDNL
jgi:5-oxoprolinase (ATP-hydrolysing)